MIAYVKYRLHTKIYYEKEKVKVAIPKSLEGFKEDIEIHCENVIRSTIDRYAIVYIDKISKK